MKLLTDKMEVGTWYRKELEGCVSSTGKPYNITLKKGTVNKLLVNFVGGGVSWNEETAARPLSLKTILKNEFYYVANTANINLKFMHVGILNVNDKRNPFCDWHVLTVPYTSADFHLGNNDYSYRNLKREREVLHHHGYKNATSALKILKEVFPQTPVALLIAGQSAGGFGCLAHAPQVKDLYPDCKNITVYSEVSHLPSASWPEIAKNVWNVEPNLLAYIKSKDLNVDLFRYAKENMPETTRFLHMNSMWDKELVAMMHKINHGKKIVNAQGLHEFYDTLLEAVRTLKKEMPNYYYYLTDYGKSKKDATTSHLFSSSSKNFHLDMQDNRSVANWLNLAIEGDAIDVGSEFTRC